tara:strand:- start:17 stop:367 length:351 start_codon:yes stop_codon:yes gene_type:complete
MTYTFKIKKIATKQDSAESDQIIQLINYEIIGTNDSSPQESASYTHTYNSQDNSPADQSVYSNSLTESAIIALVRARYDSDEYFRTNVNTYIADKIAENRPIQRVFREKDFPWTEE